MSVELEQVRELTREALEATYPIARRWDIRVAPAPSKINTVVHLIPCFTRVVGGTHVAVYALDTRYGYIVFLTTPSGSTLYQRFWGNIALNINGVSYLLTMIEFSARLYVDTAHADRHVAGVNPT